MEKRDKELWSSNRKLKRTPKYGDNANIILRKSDSFFDSDHFQNDCTKMCFFCCECYESIESCRSIKFIGLGLTFVHYLPSIVLLLTNSAIDNIQDEQINLKEIYCLFLLSALFFISLAHIMIFRHSARHIVDLAMIICGPLSSKTPWIALTTGLEGTFRMTGDDKDSKKKDGGYVSLNARRDYWHDKRFDKTCWRSGIFRDARFTPESHSKKDALFIIFELILWLCIAISIVFMPMNVFLSANKSFISDSDEVQTQTFVKYCTIAAPIIYTVANCLDYLMIFPICCSKKQSLDLVSEESEA